MSDYIKQCSYPKRQLHCFIVIEECLFNDYPLVLSGIAIAAKCYIVDSLGHCTGID